jgi:hypothetical protein
MTNEPLSKRARQRAFLQRIREPVFDKVSKATFPLFAREDAEPRLLGNGVLVGIGNKVFGLTAAHVLDEIEWRLAEHIPILVAPGGLGEPFIPLPKFNTLRSALPQGAVRKNDYCDFGVVELPETAVARLQKSRRFLRVLDVEPADELRPEGAYLVFGFPILGARTNLSTNGVTCHSENYVTTQYAGENGQLPGFDNDIEIALNFDQSRSIDDDGNASEPMDPPGMSGCGIWRLLKDSRDFENWRLGDMRLTGIAHTWDRDARVIRGTSLELRSLPSWRSTQNCGQQWTLYIVSATAELPGLETRRKTIANAFGAHGVT